MVKSLCNCSTSEVFSTALVLSLLSFDVNKQFLRKLLVLLKQYLTCNSKASTK
jgi:hypothetical protein